MNPEDLRLLKAAKNCYFHFYQIIEPDIFIFFTIIIINFEGYFSLMAVDERSLFKSFAQAQEAKKFEPVVVQVREGETNQTSQGDEKLASW